jgi:chloramphenicol 3-O-phosphotransferase
VEASPRHLERHEVAPGAIALVSGSPATGKSVLARRLAQAHARGVHFEIDPFYEFMAHPIAPTRPESHAQNEAIARAAARAIGAFAQAGYEVFADGVILPWALPIYRAELVPLGVPIDYVLVRAQLEVALARSRARAKEVPDEVVRVMHPKFAALEAEYDRHVVHNDGRSLDATMAELLARRARGELRLFG